MNVWHIGQAATLDRVDGVNAAVWLLAETQANHGVRPVLVNHRALSEGTRMRAEAHGVGVLHLRGFWPRAVRAALARERPQLVHFHSVFVPHHAALAWLLRSEGIPYIVTPHGGVAPAVLARGHRKKWLYSTLIERRRFEYAAAVTAVSQGEVDEILAFAPRVRQPVRVVPNPVAESLFTEPRRTSGRAVSRPRLTYLGRFDVHLKGIDRLYRLANLLPEVDVRLVGSPHGPSLRDLRELDRTRPPNLEVVAPVYGAAKVAELDAATMYVQMSRADAFGLAAAEAMARGTPVALTASVHLVSAVRCADAGIVLSDDPNRAALEIREALADAEGLVRQGRNGHEHSRAHFHASAVAHRYRLAYEAVS